MMHSGKCRLKIVYFFIFAISFVAFFPSRYAAAQTTGSITGRVVDRFGAGISYANVTVHSGNWNSSWSHSADSTGRYQFTGLAAGIYYVSASYHPYLSEFYPDSRSWESAAPVSVQANQITANIDLELAKGGAVSGRVAAKDGSGIADVSIILIDANQTTYYYGHTDSSGFYTVSGFPTGYYSVGTDNNAGYLDKYYDNSETLEDAAQILITEEMTTAGIDFELELGGYISGKITSRFDGSARADIYVTALDDQGTEIASTYSESSGNYTIIGLPTGNYYVSINGGSDYIDEYYNEASRLSAATLVPVTKGVITENINASLVLGGSISGKVVSASDNKGIPDLQITVYDRYWDPITSASTDQTGNYEIKGLEGGFYYLRAGEDYSGNDYLEMYYRNGTSGDAPSMVEVVVSAETPNINLALELGGAISGRITEDNSGAGLEGIYVTAYADSGDWEGDAQTDSSGNYRITGLPTGKYYVQSSNEMGFVDEYYGDSISKRSAKAVEAVQNAETPDISFNLSMGRSISGKVTDDGSTPLEWTKILVYGENWEIIKYEYSNESGKYILKGLSPGKYYLKAQSEQYLDQYYPSAGARPGASLIMVPLQEDVTGIDFILNKGGSITGQISGEFDTKVSDEIRVCASNTEGRIVECGYLNLGKYKIEGLSAGDYFVRTYDTPDYIDEYYGGSISMQGAQVVTVQQGVESKNIDIVLGTGKSIRGKIMRAADGYELAGIEVNVYDETWNLVKTTDSDVFGNYRVSGLAPGMYYLETEDTDGLSDLYYNNAATRSNATAVNVLADRDTENVNFSLAEGLSISGEVESAEDGAELQGVTVSLYNSNWEFLGSDITDEDGDYSIEGLIPGEYYLRTTNSLGYDDVYYYDKKAKNDAIAVRVVRDGWNADFELYPASMAAGDFNKDGKADLLWRNRTTGEVAVWLMNDAVRTDSAMLPSVADPDWRIVALTNANDGKGIIVWRNVATGENYAWVMDGAEKIDGEYLEKVADLNWMIADAADFNNDGNPDLLWRNSATGDNYVWFMDGPVRTGGTFLEAVPDLNWTIAGIGDFNSDDKPDILWRNKYTGDNYAWYMDGTTRNGGAYLEPAPDLKWNIVSVGDYNGDDQTDIVWRNSSTGENYVWYMNGVARTDGAYLEKVADLNWLIEDNGEDVNKETDNPSSDFNGDNNPDILWRNTASGVNAVWYMNGVNFEGSALLPEVTDLNWKIVGTGDFNKDGHVDILWRNVATGINAVWYMNGVNFEGSALLPEVTDLNWKIVGTGDFDEDGKVDILWRNVATGLNAVWYMNGVNFEGSALLPEVTDQNWKIVGTGDFNKDGHVDILWRNTATGVNAVWYINGVAFEGSALLQDVPDQNWKIVGTGDFNKDGHIDILWRNIATGINAVWYMEGTALTGSAFLDPVPDPSWTITGAGE